MNIDEILPDTWETVLAFRKAMFLNHTIQHLRRLVFEECLKCPGMRIMSEEGWIVYACVFNKCIKRYPHRYDNKEFK